jgi:hypothetical protein
MIKRAFAGSIVLASVLLFSSCSKDTETVYQPYTVPETYKFENVEYAEAEASVNMWSALNTYLGKSTSRQLSQDTVNYLWNNTNNAFTAEMVSNTSNVVVLPFTTTQLNGAGFNLAAKTTDAATFKAAMDTLVLHSKLTTTASAGVAGKIGTRLVSYKGLEYSQLVNKGLMGAFAMKQVFAYLDKVASDDNNTVVAGKGTAMQHDWDLAFGYIGIPKSYDSSLVYANTDLARPLGIGGYFRERGRYIKAGGTVFTAFLKGRAAIAAKDYAGRDAAIAVIKEYLEKTFAAAAWNYVTAPQAAGLSLDNRLHQLSEGYGFVLALKYRAAGSKLSAANYQTLSNIMNTSFHDLIGEASFDKLKQAQTILTNAYGQLQ